MRISKHIQRRNGFTLIEILIATGIFTIIAMFAVGAMLVIFDSSRKSNSSRAVMTNLNFAFENMSREIRFGQDYHCGAGAPSSPSDCGGAVGGDEEISFRFDEDDDGVLEDVYYRFEEVSAGIYTLERKVGGGSWNANGVAVISDDVRVTRGVFYVVGSSSGGVQPTVTVVVEGEAGESGSGTDTSFTVQNTLTQRIYDRL